MAEPGQQMPADLTIGTKKAFDNNYAFPYKKAKIGSETIYVCSKGSQWARTGEILVLQCAGLEVDWQDELWAETRVP